MILSILIRFIHFLFLHDFIGADNWTLVLNITHSWFLLIELSWVMDLISFIVLLIVKRRLSLTFCKIHWLVTLNRRFLLIIWIFNSILFVIGLWGIDWLYFLNTDLFWVSFSWNDSHIIYHLWDWNPLGFRKTIDILLIVELWSSKLWRGRQGLNLWYFFSDHFFDLFLSEQFLFWLLLCRWLYLFKLLPDHFLNICLCEVLLWLRFRFIVINCILNLV